MRRADIEVPNPAVDVNSWAGSACYPRRTFYPLSDGPSIQNRRITNSYFRTCSTCLSRSQAGLCVYTLRLISKQPEPTFERLRYSLGGDRPSQTTRLIVSLHRITVLGSSPDKRRVVSHRWLHRAQKPGFKASHLSCASFARTHCQIAANVHGAS